MFAGWAIPQSWTPGQLLNLRNTGLHFIATPLGEEYDPRRPENAVIFANAPEAQRFVSNWYFAGAVSPLARR